MRWLLAAVVGLAIGWIAALLTKSQRRLVTYLIVGLAGGVAALFLVDALSLTVHLGTTVISGLWADAAAAFGGAVAVTAVWYQLSRFIPG